MQRTNSLKSLLEDQTAVLNDGERLTVEFDNGSYAKFDGTVVVAPNVRDFIGRSLSGPDELRVVRDTLSHEVEHVRESVLTGKKEFAEEYGRYGKVAGVVLNVVEDAYIDRHRLRRFRGLRRTHAFVIDAIMENHQRRPRIDRLDRPEALIEGLLQVSVSGGAKGISGAEPEVQKYLAWAKRQIDIGRTTPTPEGREDVARRLTDELIDLLPKLTDDELSEMEEWVSENIPTDDAPDATADFDPTDGEGENDGPTASAGDDPDVEADETGEADDSDEGDGTAGDDEKEEDGDADQSGGSGPGDVSDEELEAMEEQARQSGDWYDAGDDYEEADDSDITRYEQLQEMIEKERNDLSQQKRERDEKADDVVCGNYRRHEKVRAAMDDGMAAEIEAAFRELKTQDHEFAAEQGDDLNIDGYIRHEAGDFMETEFYYDVERAAVGDRAVGVALDMSSSMNEMSAKTAVAALATATAAIGDQFTASAYYTSHSGRNMNPQTTLITAPDEKFEYRTLDAITASGWTPTASGIVHVEGLLDEASAREKVLIVVTDGEANVELDGSDTDGVGSARRAANSARANGVKVIGLGVGGVLENCMIDTFGPNGYVMADMENLAPALIEVYRAQLGLDEGY